MILILGKYDLFTRCCDLPIDEVTMSQVINLEAFRSAHMVILKLGKCYKIMKSRQVFDPGYDPTGYICTENEMAFLNICIDLNLRDGRTEIEPSLIVQALKGKEDYERTRASNFI